MNKREVRSPPHTFHKRKQSQRVINDLDNVDFIPSNDQFSHQEALLYVFEDNVKMIIKAKESHNETCTQQESSEERVTAKTRPMMSLIARAPSTLSSSASESPEKRSYGSQSPLSMQAEKYDRTVKPVVCRDTSHEQGHHYRFVESTHSASYSEWDDDKAWSSHEWKSHELMDDEKMKPVVCSRTRSTRVSITFLW